MAEDRMSGYQRTDMEAQGAHLHLENMLPTPTLQVVMQAIAASLEALEQKIDTMSMDLGLLLDDHIRLAEGVTANEMELLETTPTVTEANNRLNDVEQHLKVLEARAEEAENSQQQ
ncbi:hypothetical protein NDU88_001267 [Pleurodeles waltl]|uniref:Uncharacterized protein n=1 Tax=Pleurodeles waltl TaxID=8319 RepID=A0AAV7WHU4_PLEWA|nr:hypothetical protein NDU88_001267 [Pleurodeles waltl]